MCERVSNWALEELVERRVDRFSGRQIVVELLQHREESLAFLFPWKRFGIAPGLFAGRDRKSPIEQITDVRENFHRSARTLSRFKLGKFRWRIANCLASAVCQRRQSVTEEVALRIGTGRTIHESTPFKSGSATGRS